MTHRNHVAMSCLLARHGETEWNVSGRRQGHLDSPLTKQGQEHAKEVASLVTGRDLDAIYSSPLGRALDTATVIANSLQGVEVVVLDELAELHHGDFAGLTNAQIDEQFPGAFAERARQKYSWRFPNGESYADLDKRSAIALRTIQANTHQSPLVVSHAMISRMLLRNLLDLSPAEALAFNMPHGDVLDVQPNNTNPTRWLSEQRPAT